MFGFVYDLHTNPFTSAPGLLVARQVGSTVLSATYAEAGYPRSSRGGSALSLRLSAARGGIDRTFSL